MASDAFVVNVNWFMVRIDLYWLIIPRDSGIIKPLKMHEYLDLSCKLVTVPSNLAGQHKDCLKSQGNGRFSNVYHRDLTSLHRDLINVHNQTVNCVMFISTGDIHYPILETLFLDRLYLDL